MTQVGVERRQERRPLDDDAYAGMGVPVDPPFVSLGHPERPFQSKVIVRKRVIVDLHEEPWSEAFHHASHGHADGRRARSKHAGHLIEVVPAVGARPRGRVERAVNDAEIGDMDCHLIESGLYRGDSLVDAGDQLPQIGCARPPFFRFMQRFIEPRTS